MERALYRKYRSRSLSEVVGQDHVTKTLSRALKSGRIRHAYLFSGPRGVGKTSVARILAHTVNKLPYDDDSPHLDIIEIDAASNRRIDEIRDLRDKVHITPAGAKFKVYIIDEVHMLTREAFNALLKTLEEPPAHCIFILATTDVHKLPETIISRTQHFSFKPIAVSALAAHLAEIARQEKIEADPDALQLIAEFGRGSFRDSISLLDQLSADSRKIKLADARQLVGMPPARSITELYGAIESADTKQVIAVLDQLIDAGTSPELVARALSKDIRQRLVEAPVSFDAPGLLKQLLEVPASPDPRDLLEIVVLEAVINRLPAAEIPPVESSAKQLRPVTETTTAEPQLPAAGKPSVNRPSKSDFNLSDWPVVLQAIEQEQPTLYRVLRLAKPRLEPDRLILAFEFPLHRQKASQAAALAVIGQQLEAVGGRGLIVDCVVEKTASSHQPPGPKPQPDEAVETISNIFGGAEVLES